MTEGGTGRTQRARDDEQVPWPRPGPAGDSCRAADRRDAQNDLRGRRRIAAEDRDTRLSHAGVQLEDVGDLGVARRRERDDEANGAGSRGREVAEIHRGRTPAEVAPRDPVKTEVDALDEGVLRDDETVHLGGVVLDSPREPALLELGQQPELDELRKL